MISSLMRAAAVSAAVLSSVAGAASALNETQPRPEYAAVPTGNAALSLRPFGTRFANGDAIGTARTGIGCSDSADLRWSELIARRVELEVQEALRHGLAQSGWATPGAIEVASLVSDFRVDVCGLGRSGWKGDFYLQIDWSVSAEAPRRVDYRASTSGLVRQLEPARGSAVDGLRRAVAQAVGQLVADPRLAQAFPRAPDSGTLAENR